MTQSPFEPSRAEPSREPNRELSGSNNGEPDREPALSSERSATEVRPEAAGPTRPLTFDEVVAVLVAFLSLGSVLLWGLTRGGITLVSDSPVSADTAAVTPQSTQGSSDVFGLGREDADSAEDANAAAPSAGGDRTNTEANTEANTEELSAVEAARRNLASQAEASRDRTVSQGIGDRVRTGVAGAAAGIAGVTTLPERAPAAAVADSTTVPLSAAATATPKDSIRFDDVPDNYWAKPYIDALSSRDLISGFEDGDFKPDQFVTRAQIANIVSRTFDLTSDKENLAFSDVAGDYWARESIGQVVQGGFMTGFPNNTFNPNAPVTRTQALTTLVTGLNIQPPTNAQAALSRYTDAAKVPTWATGKVAAATAGNLVVNYPNLQQLNPDQPTTRAELSAMIYQALAKEGIVEPIDSEYVVKP